MQNDTLIVSNGKKGKEAGTLQFERREGALYRAEENEETGERELVPVHDGHLEHGPGGTVFVKH